LLRVPKRIDVDLGGLVALNHHSHSLAGNQIVN
jgi:hypothetical protein